jgi:hypothetical protein
MKRILSLLMLVFPLAGFCQDKNPSRRLTAIGVTISPDFSYRLLNFSSSNQWVADMRDRKEVGNSGFTAGIQAHHRLGNKLKLETALMYSNKSIETKYEALAWASDDIDLATRSKTIYHFKFLMIPVGFSYRFVGTKKVSLFVTAGLSPSVFFSTKTKVVSIYANGDKRVHASSKQTGHTLFSLFVSAGAGIDYSISKRFTFRVQPFYQRSLTSVVADNDAREFLFSYGIATAVCYSFF